MSQMLESANQNGVADFATAIDQEAVVDAHPNALAKV
jgi:hypothetical protein